MLGGKARVVEPDAWDPCLERRFLRVMPIADFRVLHHHEWTDIRGKRGAVRIRHADSWLEHPARRTYHGGVVCDPEGHLSSTDYLNLWRGWAVPPDATGDPTPFLDHLRMLTSDYGPSGFHYILGWLAQKVQHPGEKLDVALVLRGGRGVGKGFFGHTMLRLFGSHGLHIAHPDRLVGRFTNHLLDCCFLFADECFYAGDKKHESVLKALITEPVNEIEGKYQDAYQARNRLGLLMASNSDWILRAGDDERRFAVFDVPKTRQRDDTYWDSMWKGALCNRACLGAFLHYLLSFDLRDYKIREIPQTAALQDQKLASLEPAESWLLERLHAGFFPAVRPYSLPAADTDTWGWDGLWARWLPTTILHADHCAWMVDRGLQRRTMNSIHFGRMLARYFAAGRRGGRTDQQRGYELGTLDAARRAFTDRQRLPALDWG